MKENSVNTEIINTLVYQNENNIKHSSFEREMQYYKAVKNADFDYIEKYYHEFDVKQLGRLSDNEITNLKYHLIITIALLARFCIQGHMDYEYAYTLSDVYIRKCDKCTTKEDIYRLHKQVVYEFAQRMVDVKTDSIKSVAILECIEYINDNISDKITLEKLSEVCNLNSSYLSILFKKEMGVSVSQYITKKKIDVAKDMLKIPDNTPIFISNYLSFCSHSYFIKTFKKITGKTPEVYRNTHYRKNFK